MADLAVDTGVIGASLDERRAQLWGRYEPHLVGANLYVALQTVAELRFGALNAGWGPAKMHRLDQLVADVTPIEIDDDLVWEHARLRLACRRAGHPLADRVHAGDLWVAASAVFLGVTLVADDAVFEDAPGLDLIREPA